MTPIRRIRRRGRLQYVMPVGASVVTVAFLLLIAFPYRWANADEVAASDSDESSCSDQLADGLSAVPPPRQAIQTAPADVAFYLCHQPQLLHIVLVVRLSSCRAPPVLA